MLTEQLLKILREWYRFARPTVWMFPGVIPGSHISVEGVQDACKLGRERSGLKKPVTPHSLRHAQSAGFTASTVAGGGTAQSARALLNPLLVERPRLEVADILRRYGAAYRAEHVDAAATADTVEPGAAVENVPSLAAASCAVPDMNVAVGHLGSDQVDASGSAECGIRLGPVAHDGSHDCRVAEGRRTLAWLPGWRHGYVNLIPQVS